MLKILDEAQMVELYEKNKEIEFLSMDSILSLQGLNIFFVEIEGDIIKGLLKLKTGGREALTAPGFTNWLSFISVKKEEQGKGISTSLIKALYKYLEENKLDHLLKDKNTSNEAELT